MFSKAFALATAERAVKTFAQGLIAFLATDVTGLFDVDWARGWSISGLAAFVSVLTSVVSGAVTSQPGPSLVSAEVLAPAAVLDRNA